MEKVTRFTARDYLEVIQSALEWAGVIFVKENGHGPVVRLRK
jgi:hypothetical protein